MGLSNPTLLLLAAVFWAAGLCRGQQQAGDVFGPVTDAGPPAAADSAASQPPPEFGAAEPIAPGARSTQFGLAPGIGAPGGAALAQGTPYCGWRACEWVACRHCPRSKPPLPRPRCCFLQARRACSTEEWPPWRIQRSRWGPTAPPTWDAAWDSSPPPSRFGISASGILALPLQSAMHAGPGFRVAHPMPTRSTSTPPSAPATASRISLPACSPTMSVCRLNTLERRLRPAAAASPFSATTRAAPRRAGSCRRSWPTRAVRGAPLLLPLRSAAAAPHAGSRSDTGAQPAQAMAP